MSGIVGYEPKSSTDIERKLDLLVQTGLNLARATHLEAIIQASLRAGFDISGAQYGAFLSLIDCGDQGCTVHLLGGEKTLLRSPLAHPPELSDGTVTDVLGDIRISGRFEPGWRFPGTSSESQPTLSYLAAPVVSAMGDVLGKLMYGHPQADAFTLESQRLVETIAAQAAIAMKGAMLRQQNRTQLDELQETEQRLEEAVKRLSELAAIVESSDDAIISKDLTGQILTWNASASRIFGYSESEIVGQSILKLIPPELQHEEQGILSKIRSGQRIEHYETIRMTKGGERLNVSLSISPVRDSAGQIVAASKILRDITERKRIEASLLEAEKISATGRMAATIAHEINNPLEAVVNLLYLARSSETIEQSNDYVSAAEAEVGRVSHIARQTLGFYRENASAISTPISKLAADALKIYTPRCNGLGILVEAKLRSRRSIVVRSGEILQVLSNLIANAIQAMSEVGTLTLSADDTEEPAGVIIRVTDTGNGIADEQLPHIFKAFYTTRGSIGTGIGLFVASQLVAAHGGNIRVDTSTAAENHGTSMSIFLPLVTPYAP